MTSYESKKPSKIIGIQFSILSPHEIQKASVAEITNRDTYVNNKPVLGGLFDPRMGILEPGFICPTDGLDYIQTPGYFGHMNLARPVFYIQYLATIMKILRCVCIKCSKILIDKDKYNYLLTANNDERWQKVFAFASKKKRCGEDSQNGCGCLQPKLKKEGLATLIAEWNEKEESTENTTLNADNKLIMKLVPELVIKILRKISDEDVNFMGFSPIWSRPEWMICQTMAVPPPAVRPSVKHDAQQRSEDDLTHILINIIKANKTLQEKIEANSNANIIDDWTTVLQYYVATLVDNKIPGVAAVAQRSGRPLKAIKDRLNGKGGRVRGNLMGKRVDFSARSVITPDPNLSISELGVPLKIAKNLTKPITVNSKNKNYLMKFILNGPDEYPGAKIYEKKNGDCISLRFIDRESIVLEDGDIVHRHILDGDAVLFNRQPTLHRMSMMCHLAKIMFKGDTFRMNVGDTKPYNADFDGDEMNLHMPQDEESEAELRHLAAVQYQIISPANNKSIVGIFQDSLLGSYLFTRKDVVFDSRQAMNLLMHFDKIDLTAINFKKSGLKSFELLSQIIPNITMKYKTKKFDDAEDYATSNNVLEINKGTIVRGQIEKGVLGDTTRGLLQRIYNDFGSSCSRDFVDDLQNIVTEYMKSYSYSVGISDLIADSDTNNKIVEVINQKKLDVKSLIDETHLGIFENKTGKPNVEEFETQVNNILNKASFEAGKIGRKNLDANNRFVIMVNAGSKGSDLNISQMISCLGQQNVDGKRIPYGFEDRTLPHFTKFNDSPEARGFVESSFIGGLRPEELFFHAMGGRVGLIDTAVKSVTWETPIIIIENNEPKYVKIGEFVDTKMKNNDFVEKHDERNLELLNTNNIFIPTTNEDGIVSWEEVTALTRHDPGEKLYQIKTLGGRDVIVTENKSLLIWQEKDKKLKEMYSPDIKIGDCVPVTQDLCDPPIIKEYIELEKYLIKEKYIYGSDFNKAIDLMNNEMISKKKIPDNWWENNNKINFTLPYTKKSSLQRTNVRSNTNNIKNNCVYPYSGIRNNTEISDKFILNKQNGIFIGLFLAEGNVHNSHITITNNNEFIRNFVKSWFDSYNINYNEKTKINKLNGTTTTITGNSCIMSEFITKLVGSGAKNKYVPDEAFIAPKEFVIGLLNGYFSGDGYVGNNSIEASSASKRLIEGINMLCSRLGIFGKVFTTIMKKNNINTENILPAHRISIRAQWAKLFAEKVDLIHNDKSRKLYNAKFTSNHRNFKTFNNVVLDKITEINIIGVENHPKMYDLTIPTTLNFGLANGLQVRDTSQTGYIQRRIIKSLEDLMVNYDMTVRNNKGKIIQYTYGDDGFDPVFVESQQIPFINMNVEEIYGHYQMPNDSTSDSIYNTLYTKQTLTRFKKQKPELKTKTQFYIDYLIDHRKKIVENVLKFIYKGSVNLPVSFVNIINNIAGNQEENVIVDITPIEVFNLIEANFDNLNLIHYCKPTELFKVLYYYYLSPKELLMHKKLTKKSIELLLLTINNSYKKAIVAPGEMVGMIAAQSIGEPTTQLTLNTFHFAGVASKSNVTRGVPRIEEILSLSENPKNPSCTIYLNELEKYDQNKVKEHINELEYTRLRDLVNTIEICFDPSDTSSLLDGNSNIIEEYNEFEKMLDECSKSDEDSKEKSKWILRLNMNKNQMLDKSMTMEDIHFALNSSFDNLSCMYTDYNSDELIFRIRISKQIQAAKKKKSKLADSLDQSDEIYILKNLQNNLLDTLILRGIKKIQKVLLRKITDNLEEVDMKYVKKEEWVLDTVGTNLLDLLALDFVDSTRTITNSIIEIYNVLGVEAARQSIFDEFSEVIEFDSTYINYHHLTMLCDRMCCNDKMVSVFRHGINNDNIGPIAKASFEETPEMFLKAARHGELDMMRGVSANVMTGQQGYFGTNAFKLLTDMDFMMTLNENSISEDKQYDDSKNFKDVKVMDNYISKELNKTYADNIECNISSLEINYSLNNIKETKLGIDDDYDLDF